MNKALAVFFFMFICGIIYLANFKTENVIFFYIDKVPHADKLGHFFLYGLLALLTNMALEFRFLPIQRFKTFAPFAQIGSLAVLLFAIAEELSQYFLPTRTMGLADAICDLLGVGLFTLFSVAIMRSRKNGEGEKIDVK